MTELVAIAVVVAAMSGEVPRLRAHFAQVDRELQARDLSHLTAVQRNTRAIHIARLREYAARGVFPKNTRHPGVFVPYFVDDVGTRCAMAFLIEQSGAVDYVRNVAARMNNAYIAEIAGDPVMGAALFAWLEANGLTADEAARIQPAYGPCGFPGCPPEEEPKVSTGYKVGSGAAIVTGLSSLALNTSMTRLGLSRRTAGWLGFGVGAAGLALGASALDKGDEYGTLRMFNTGVGMLAAAVGLYAILSRGPSAPTATAARPPEPRVTAAPLVATSGSGVAVSIRF